MQIKFSLWNCRLAEGEGMQHLKDPFVATFVTQQK